MAGALAEELGRGVREAVSQNGEEEAEFFRALSHSNVSEQSSEPEIFNRHFAPVVIVPRQSTSFASGLLHHGHERSSLLADWIMRPDHLVRVVCGGFVARAKIDDK